MPRVPLASRQFGQDTQPGCPREAQPVQVPSQVSQGGSARGFHKGQICPVGTKVQSRIGPNSASTVPDWASTVPNWASTGPDWARARLGTGTGTGLGLGTAWVRYWVLVLPWCTPCTHPPVYPPCTHPATPGTPPWPGGSAVLHHGYMQYSYASQSVHQAHVVILEILTD